MQTLVINYKGKPCTTSRLVAEKFGKEHKNVIVSIRDIIQRAENSAGQLFIESQYVDEKGQMRPQFIMNRDGFTLLVMGFTGEKALQFKIEYINAFNHMESLIHNNINQISRKELAQMIIELENEKEKLQEINQIQQKELIEVAPKKEYHDKVLSSAGHVKINVIAEDMGISAQKLNKILADHKVQYLQNGVWFLYSEYRKYDIAFHKPFPYTNKDGEIVTKQHLYWTEKGRKYIHILTKYGKKEAFKVLNEGIVNKALLQAIPNNSLIN